MSDPTDITEEELQKLYDEIDAEFEAEGCPSDEELASDVEALNQ